ncbi:MAG TPA: pilus assembly protein TadG-related protein [Gaiellaceae bacterium]|nr:pilus assembly protein TadG-related protein [Gaiellaceae bacterium]
MDTAACTASHGRWGEGAAFAAGRTASCRQRGQVVVLVALLLPALMALGSIVIAVGNWFVHARHLQTKVDAAALAGGGVWGFPCGPDIDANIEAQARRYVGPHTAADGTTRATPFNPQVGGVGADRIYVALNQATWWSGSFAAADFTSPSGSVCQSKVLDVKATERDAPLLWSWLPFFPDIKRKARVQIEEVEGLTGLLPIAVRVPQPLSAAAVFYDEASATKEILDVRPFRQICTVGEPTCIFGAPPGLGHWTTEPKTGSTDTWAQFSVRAKTGLVVATSVRPSCAVGSPPCLDTSPATWKGKSIDDYCRQAGDAVQCYDADGAGSAQLVRSGVHLIAGYENVSVAAGPNVPQVRDAWLENVSCAANGYFNSMPTSCRVKLNVRVDIGSCLRGPGECFDDPSQTPAKETRKASPDPLEHNVQVRYCLARSGQTGSVCDGQFSEAQELACTGGPGVVTCSSQAGTHPLIQRESRENAFAIEVRLRRTEVTGFPECRADGDFKDTCRFFYTGNGYAGDSVLPTAEQILAAPLHRSFMGGIDRTGPLKWLRLTVDTDCVMDTLQDRIVGQDPLSGKDAASQPRGQERCYIVEMGMAGGLARDQDEPPIALNLGTGSSQRAVIDCDPSIPNLKEEIQLGCQSPSYAANKFDTTPVCPGTAGFFNLPKPEPFANWPPFRCVLTQTTANPEQIIQGFNLRLFGRQNNPKCPADLPRSDPSFTWGRNYWHRANNANNDEITFAWDADTPDRSDDWGNEIADLDPRLVTLFFTSYRSFDSPGNEVYPIIGFGNFYITGYGTTQNGSWQGGAPDDPCTDGNSSGITGAGNLPPPDLDYSRNTTWVWGHFVKDVKPNPFSTSTSGILCNPEASFQPCVAVLVE